MAKAGKKTFLRLIRTIFGFFPVLLPLVLIGILFNAIVGSIPAVFMQKVIAVVEQNWQSGDWNGCKDEILRYTGILLTLYGLALAASIFYNRKMAEITQGTLKKLREKMFNSMQGFPVKYFDTHNHGDIMSYYTASADLPEYSAVFKFCCYGNDSILRHALLQYLDGAGGSCRCCTHAEYYKESRGKLCKILYPAAESYW